MKRASGYKARRLDLDAEALMNPFWSQIARELSPYVPGEQPRIANLVKLNTNESPFGRSPLALESMRVAVTDEHLFGLHAMMSSKHLTQFRRLGIRIEPQGVSCRVSHRFQCERRGAKRAFVGVELHQIGDARLFAGHIGRKLARDPAPERVHIKSMGQLWLIGYSSISVGVFMYPYFAMSLLRSPGGQGRRRQLM